MFPIRICFYGIFYENTIGEGGGCVSGESSEHLVKGEKSKRVNQSEISHVETCPLGTRGARAVLHILDEIGFPVLLCLHRATLPFGIRAQCNTTAAPGHRIGRQGLFLPPFLCLGDVRLFFIRNVCRDIHNPTPCTRIACNE